MSSESGAVGRHWATQLVLAVEYLRKHPHPHRLQDLALHSSCEGLLTNPDLLAQFNAHDRVKCDHKTGLYEYKPTLQLGSKSDLVSLLVRSNSSTGKGGGLMVKQLREAWPGVITAIEELEREGRVLVTRTGVGPAGAAPPPASASGASGGGPAGAGTLAPQGTMKAVFLDEIGLEGRVDQEFRSLWSALRTPIADELRAELDKAGLTASHVTSAPKPAARGKKGKKAGYRRVKLTNTHLSEKGGGIDLTKDYVAKK